MKTTVCAILLTCAIAGSSAHAGTGQITGTIFEESTGFPIAGICAEVYGVTTGNEVESEPTGSDGVYTLSGLDPDTVQLIAYDCVPPVDYPLVEYQRRRKSLHGAHDSTDGARLVRLHRDGQIKSKRDFRVPAAGHFAVTVVDDATNLPVAGVIVRPSAFPQPRFGSTVLSGFFGVSDDNGQLTLDVNPGGSALSAIFGSASDYLVTPPVFVDSGATQPVEIRIP